MTVSVNIPIGVGYVKEATDLVGTRRYSFARAGFYRAALHAGLSSPERPSVCPPNA